MTSAPSGTPAGKSPQPPAPPTSTSAPSSSDKRPLLTLSLSLALLHPDAAESKDPDGTGKKPSSTRLKEVSRQHRRVPVDVNDEDLQHVHAEFDAWAASVFDGLVAECEEPEWMSEGYDENDFE